MPYREDVVHRSAVLEIRWERADPDAPRILVLSHDPGADGVPEQRRLPEGYGLEILGGVLGLLGLGALLLHRVARSVEPRPTTVRFGPDTLSKKCVADVKAWSTGSITGFGAGRDSPELRTVFVAHAGGREIVLEGLPPDDARRAVELLEEARRELA